MEQAAANLHAPAPAMSFSQPPFMHMTATGAGHFGTEPRVVFGRLPVIWSDLTRVRLRQS